MNAALSPLAAHPASRFPIRSVALCAKADKPDVNELKSTMCRWFTKRGVPCVSFSPDRSAPDLQENINETDIIIVLGGDGTFVSVARQLAPHPKPMIGVNLGRVGFLAEISPEHWQNSFEKMLNDGVVLEKSLGLHYALIRDDVLLFKGLSVNDLVVSRGGPARLVSLALTVDDLKFAVLRADGLIVSTPTGSTGYTGSARGPLLHPKLNAYALTPICPFMSNFLPMVVAGETKFSITVVEAGPEIYLTVDGQESIEIARGDILTVNGRPNSLLFARIDDEGYFAKLRSTGFVRDFSK